MVWADTSYYYKKKITIDNTKVTSNEVDFPVLVKVTDEDFADTSNGGHVKSSSGFDIVFYDSTESKKLNHEIERYTYNTGAIVFWVQLDVSSTSDTEFYIYYGKSGVVADPSSTSTWDSNFLGVYHLDEKSGATCYDSTSNGNNGTHVDTLPTQAEAKIGYGQTFDTSDYINLPEATHIPTAGTVEMWHNGAGGDEGYYYARDPDGVITHYIVCIAPVTTTNFYNKAGNPDSFTMAGGTTDSTYQYLSIGWEEEAQNLRLDKTSAGTDNATGLEDFDFTEIRLGNSHTGGHGLNAQMDEARVSNIKRTDAWRDTTYETQNTPAAFLKDWGDEESLDAITSGDIAINTESIGIDVYMDVSIVRDKEIRLRTIDVG